jgi:hypothetical protein
MILLLELTALSVLVTYCWVDAQSGAILTIFNILFFWLFSQLKGDTCFKLSLLVTGNVFGLVWSYSFHMLILYARTYEVASTTTLHTIYTIVYPLLNAFWVIAFWSLSATVLHSARNLRWVTTHVD